MSDSKTRNATRNLGDSVVQAGQLEDSAYKNQAALPTQSENDAKLFSDIGKQFSRPGDRPRGILANIGAGFSRGLEHGAMSNAISEKKENFGKYQKEMDYLKAVQKNVVEKNQWHAEQEKRLETVKPFAVGGLEISYSGMDYATGNERMRNVIEQAKIADPTIKGDYIGYVPNSPIVNLRTQDGEIIAYSLSNLVGEDVVKRVQGNYIDQQKQKTSEDRLQLESKYMPDKYSVQREKLEQTTRRNDQNAMKSDTKLSETLGKKIDSSREFLTIAPKMEEIVKNHPDIFQSAIDATWRESKEPGFINNMLKDVQNKWNPDKVAALTSMVKYINKMTLDVANGFARPNMFIEKIGSKAVPNLDMNPQGFLKVLEEMKYENETSIKNNLSRFDLLKSDMDSGISDQYRESTNEVMGQNKGSANTVTIINPETNETVNIDESQLDAAISGGWQVGG